MTVTLTQAVAELERAADDISSAALEGSKALKRHAPLARYRRIPHGASSTG